MYRDREAGLVFHRGHIARSAFGVWVLELVNVSFCVLYVLFATRFVIEYVQAPAVPFVTTMKEWSNVFLAHFSGLIASGHDCAGHPFAWWVVLGFAAYAALHFAVRGLLRSMNHAPVAQD